MQITSKQSANSIYAIYVRRTMQNNFEVFYAEQRLEELKCIDDDKDDFNQKWPHLLQNKF